MTSSRFTSFSGSMFLKTIFLNEVLNVCPLPVHIIQPLGRGIPGEPLYILRNLPPPPGWDVFQGLGINDSFHGFSSILLYATTLQRTYKPKRQVGTVTI